MKAFLQLLLAVACALVAAPLQTTGADSKDPVKPKTNHQDELFSQPKVLQLKLEIPAAGLQALKKDPKAYVKATLREGDKTYADAGVRLKGHGAFDAQEKK